MPNPSTVQRRWRCRRAAAAAAAAMLILISAVATTTHEGARAEARPLARGAGSSGDLRGHAIFDGRVAIPGKIRDHKGDLPPEVVRCGSCHGEAGPPTRAGAGGSKGGASPALAIAAPHLDRGFLLDARARRGGPPSVYDVTSFCRLLRTGTDAAYILVAREMPTYRIDDRQCSDLWTYLTRPEEITREKP